MNKSLKYYISKSGLKNNPVCLLQAIKSDDIEAYESIESELQYLIDENFDTSDILSAVTDCERSEFIDRVDALLTEFMQGLIDEVEICDSLDALKPANDPCDIEAFKRARDMGAES